MTVSLWSKIMKLSASDPLCKNGFLLLMFFCCCCGGGGVGSLAVAVFLLLLREAGGRGFVFC